MLAKFENDAILIASNLPASRLHKIELAWPRTKYNDTIRCLTNCIDPKRITTKSQRCLANGTDSKVHGTNMGPIWGQQDPGRPHVGPMNFAIWGPSIAICGTTVLNMLKPFVVPPWSVRISATSNFFSKLEGTTMNHYVLGDFWHGSRFVAGRHNNRSSVT